MRSAFASLAALALIGFGIGTLIAPNLVSTAFGVPSDDANARMYLRGVGSRDAVLGALIAVFLLQRRRQPLVTTIGLTSLAGASDLVLVAALRGAKAAPNLALHIAGTAGLFGLSVAFGRETP